MSANSFDSVKFDYCADIAACRLALQKSFLPSNGLKIMNRYQWRSYVADFVVLRNLPNGESQKFIVEVNLEESPSIADINKFRQFSASHQSIDSEVIGNLIVSPKDELGLSLPGNIQYMSLNELKNNGLADEIDNQKVLVA